MIADPIRTDAFRRALENVVEPGCTVIDIGTGIGIFAVLACRLGARRVYAIEPDPAIEVARKVAAEAGFADRIEFIPELSTEASLPERADVAVADVNGVLPLHEQSLVTLIDARERLLTARGKLVPARTSVWAALTRSPDGHPHDVSTIHSKRLGVDLSASVPFATSIWQKATNMDEDQLLTEPRLWISLDYGSVSSVNAKGSLSWTIASPRTADSICAWFDTDLTDGVTISNAPGRPRAIYGQALFPLGRPLELTKGDSVEVDMRATLVGGEYVWAWSTHVIDADGRERHHLKQTTAGARPFTFERLRRREASHRPVLREDGEIARLVLAEMDGNTALTAIADQLVREFPESFADSNEALKRVAQLSETFAR